MEDVSAILSSATEGENNNSASTVTASQTGPTHEELHLRSQELLVFRNTLRFLSLWCPAAANLAERMFYPFIVNLLLLTIIILDFFVLAKQSWKSLELYVFVAIDLGMYSSHAFGLCYFRSRDLEDNMIDLQVNRRFIRKLRKKLGCLKIGIIISYSLLLVLVLVFFNTEAWLNGHYLCKSSFTFLHGVTSHIVCMLNYPINIYGVGCSLAISWTMCLFQQICWARLQNFVDIYLRWTQSTEEAIYKHLEDYSRKVKKSCSRLAKWFIAHNFILIIATPVVFVDIIKEFEEIPGRKALHPILFVGFLIYTVVIWVAPLYFAELLQIHDEKFCSAVNEFCPGTLREELEREKRELGENEIRELGENEFTFQSRTEVNKFLSYLNNRKTGFLMGSYSFQLKLAMLSIFLAVLSFTLRFTVSLLA